MRIVFITQAFDANHPLLGVAVDWVGALVDLGVRVDVIASTVRADCVPDGIRLFSLGKERRAGRVERIAKLASALTCRVLVVRPDAIFAHMCPPFAVAAAPFARIACVPLVLWYAHKSVSWQLRLAHSLVDAVATASNDELGITGPKIRVLGHGIATERFAGLSRAREDAPWRVVAVGRIAPVKKLEAIVDAARHLGHDARFQFRLVGEVSASEHEGYGRLLRASAAALPIEFAGAVAHAAIANEYARADAYVSAYRGEGWDKATLEACASGRPCFVAGVTARQAHGDLDTHFGFDTGDELATKLARFFTLASHERSDLTRQQAERWRVQDARVLMSTVIELIAGLRRGWVA
ncbi:MAG: glycosyltransferase [Chloroflexota bacterium]|nr:MAG: glycosyltransferase [Chloroflexota bacterium]